MYASQMERMKYQVAMELGLLDKVMENGWAGLTAEESGRVGGIVSSRLRRAGGIKK